MKICVFWSNIFELSSENFPKSLLKKIKVSVKIKLNIFYM